MVCLSRSYYPRFFKGCLPQTSLGPLLTTLPQIDLSILTLWLGHPWTISFQACNKTGGWYQKIGFNLSVITGFITDTLPASLYPPFCTSNLLLYSVLARSMYASRWKTNSNMSMTVLFQQDYMSWFMENITLFTHIYHISK